MGESKLLFLGLTVCFLKHTNVTSSVLSGR